MAEGTPSTTFADFLAEEASLLSTIAGYGDPPALGDLDDLALATTRLQLVQAQIPALRTGAEAYEQGLIRTATIAAQGTIWGDAATAKATALADIMALRNQLLTAMQAYNAASGVQQSCLMRLPV